MKKLHAGFTLIELMVVISIIAMLTSVILVSLNSARLKGKDTSAIQSMNSMRNAAALVATNNVYPANLCSSANFMMLITAVQKQVPNTVNCQVDNPVSGGVTRWAASVQLNNLTTFCVDSSGFVGKSNQMGAVCSSGSGS